MLKSNIPKFRCALVTGAASGIGLALCHLLASKGIKLIISGRNVDRLSDLADELREVTAVDIVVADLAISDQRQRIIEVIYKEVPDLIINNAGYGSYGEALSYQTSDQLQILEVNAHAVLEVSLEAARAMRTKGIGGVIMNVSSTAAFQVFPGMSVYSAAKAFVNQFSCSFDYEMKPYGIRVLAACPGMVATGFRSRASGKLANDKPVGMVMSAEFAAGEIWDQICQKKPQRIFDWKYRIGAFFSRYILPNSILARGLRANIDARGDTRPFIPVNSVVRQTILK